MRFLGHVPEKCAMTNRRLPGNQVYGELNCPDAIETDQGAYSCEAISSMVRGKISCEKIGLFNPLSPLLSRAHVLPVLRGVVSPARTPFWLLMTDPRWGQVLSEHLAPQGHSMLLPQTGRTLQLSRKILWNTIENIFDILFVLYTIFDRLFYSFLTLSPSGMTASTASVLV